MSIQHNGSKLRNKFWIPRDTPTIKSVLNRYLVCFDQRGQRYHVPDNPDLPEFRFDCSNPWKETFLDITNHYLLRRNMVMQRKFISLSLCVLRQDQATLKLPGMLPRKLLQIHLKGFVLRMGSLKRKPFLTKVAIFKLLIINLIYSDNYQKHTEVSSASSL